MVKVVIRLSRILTDKNALKGLPMLFDGFAAKWFRSVKTTVHTWNEALALLRITLDLKHYGTFDYIVVGSGAGGSVMTSRLSEEMNWTVLVIEAGDFGNDETDIPFLFGANKFSRYDWGFSSTPQETCCLGFIDQKCPLPQGKGIGGTTLINGLVYARGSSIDYDRWAEHTQDNRWSYKHALPYFKKSERFNHRDPKAPFVPSVHGRNGLLNVENFLPESPQLQAWLRANKELGYRVTDYNAGTGLGASPAQVNTKNGKRFDDGKAFIRPFLCRPNLNISTNSYVTKVLIDPDTKTAEGVIFSTTDKKQYRARASKEVILCAGAIQTPHLLMLSGIGPKDHLESLNISVIENLQVGSRLKDHAGFKGLHFGSNYTVPNKSITEYVEEYLKGYGQYSIPARNQGVGFFESSHTRGTGYPDLEIMLIPASVSDPLAKRGLKYTDQTFADLNDGTNSSQTFLIVIILLHGESSGTVRLKSSDPFEDPVIDINLLSDRRGKDIGTMYEGIQIALKLASTDALQSIAAKLEGGPLTACKQFEYLSKEYWYCALRQLTQNVYHPVSTCPMGPNTDKGDVVDSKGKVHGVKKLRIADASVFPFALSGHTNAAVVLVAEIISDLVKMEYQ